MEEKLGLISARPNLNMGSAELDENGLLLDHAVSYHPNEKFECACPTVSKIRRDYAIPREYRYGDVEETLDFLKGMMSGVGVGFELTFAGVASFTCNMLCSWVSTVTLAYLADVIASSLLNGKKGGGFISAVIFVLLTMGVFRVVDLLPGAADTDVNYYVQSAYNLVPAAICCFLTARIMDRYLSV